MMADGASRERWHQASLIASTIAAGAGIAVTQKTFLPERFR